MRKIFKRRTSQTAQPSSPTSRKVEDDSAEYRRWLVRERSRELIAERAKQYRLHVWHQRHMVMTEEEAQNQQAETIREYVEARHELVSLKERVQVAQELLEKLATEENRAEGNSLDRESLVASIKWREERIVVLTARIPVLYEELQRFLSEEGLKWVEELVNDGL